MVLRESSVRVPCIGMKNVAAKVGEIASRYFDNPSAGLFVIAFTGTNGKTSCSHLVAEGLEALGRRCGVLGTMGVGFPGALDSGTLTTPDAIALQRALADIVGRGGVAVSLEASSHGLAQQRLNGTSIDVAVFTNITRDHLDYHSDFSEYREAKRLLFEWPTLKAAVLNIDDDFGIELAGSLDDRLRIVTYSRTNEEADVHCTRIDYKEDGTVADVMTPWGGGEISTSLLGDFNLSNVLAVGGVLGLMEYGFADIEAAARHLRTVKGRMDLINRPGFPGIVIDYAHSPDALENVLRAVRRHCRGRLWCVFGCGGDRDKGKRPMMGRVAESLADRVVITDDNPRTESSTEIIGQILEGITDRRKVHAEADRAAAIAFALSAAATGDIVLLAGKGHEEYQEVGDRRVSYSDYAQVEKFFAGNER